MNLKQQKSLEFRTWIRESNTTCQEEQESLNDSSTNILSYNSPYLNWNKRDFTIAINIDILVGFSQTEKRPGYGYWASINEIVTLFTEQTYGLPLGGIGFCRLLTYEKAGCFGEGKTMCSNVRSLNYLNYLLILKQTNQET